MTNCATPAPRARVAGRLAPIAPLALSLCALAGAPASAQEFRTITGEFNNPVHSEWGAAGTMLVRCPAGAFYGGVDQTWEMGGENRVSARMVSNLVFAQPELVFDDRALTDMVWQWGQFLDHDLDLTPGGGSEAANIPVPAGDPWFDPKNTGAATIGFSRAIYQFTEGMPWREQPNLITHFLDASNVYGSDPVKAWWLREGVGGRLKVSAHASGDLLPFGDGVVENDNGPMGADPTTMFVAGDIRCNEQSGLASMHTLWVREHNRLADALAAANPAWSDEEVYQRARSVVSALMQVVTYNEFLPALLGENALPNYSGYNPDTNPTILNEFSASAYRVGHTMLSSEILRLGENQQPIPQGNLLLRNMFFNPSVILDNGGIEPILRGLTTANMQRIDTRVVDDVRNFLFGPPGSGGLDLVSLNIQRGRDHGLPDYNTLRMAVGLPAKATFAQITSDPDVQAGLAAAYGDTSDMDLWAGLLAEDHVPGAAVGETLRAVLADQFTRLRDGDRFFYLNPADPADLAGTLAALGMTIDDLDATTLGQVIKRNTSIVWLHDYVFRLRLTGDANGNGRVDFADLNGVLANYGVSAVGVAGDTNGDGVVDFADLQNVLTGFGSSY